MSLRSLRPSLFRVACSDGWKEALGTGGESVWLREGGTGGDSACGCACVYLCVQEVVVVHVVVGRRKEQIIQITRNRCDHIVVTDRRFGEFTVSPGCCAREKGSLVPVTGGWGGSCVRG